MQAGFHVHHGLEMWLIIGLLYADEQRPKTLICAHRASRISSTYHTQAAWRKCEVTQSCLALCDPMDYSLPGSSVHGTFQARVLEWVAISFSRGSSQPRDWTGVSHIARRRFTIWATREALSQYYKTLFLISVAVPWITSPESYNLIMNAWNK